MTFGDEMAGNLPPAGAARGEKLRSALERLAIAMVFLTLATIAIGGGVRLRQWVFDYTTPIRYHGDITRGYFWGTQANEHGYLDLYDRLGHQDPNAEQWLDYAPLRLAVMYTWARANASQYDYPDEWRPAREFHSTVLRFNTGVELITAMGVFLLARYWVVRSDRVPAPPGRIARWFRTKVMRSRTPNEPSPMDGQDRPTRFFRGWTHGFIAALLVWFNPAIIISAHGWPTWDLWVIPFYLYGILLACTNRWFLAGMVIGAGAMFKGQQFMVAPIFVLWALFSGQPLHALRWALGLVFAIGALASPWMLTTYSQNGDEAVRSINRGAAYWVGGAMLTMCVAVILSMTIQRRRKSPAPADAPPEPSSDETDEMKPTMFRRLIARPGRIALLHALLGAGVFLSILYPWLTEANRTDLGMGLAISALIAGGLVGAMCLRRHRLAVIAGALGICLLFCMRVQGASHHWADASFGYGQRHWVKLVMGVTSNLPGILKERFGWKDADVTTAAFTIDARQFLLWPAEPFDVNWKMTFAMIYFALLVPCAIGMAMHARRNDRRFLIAMTTPWLLFFCFPAQIHERYLLYAAGVSCTLAAVGAGMALLSVFMSIVTYIMTIQVMLIAARWRMGGEGMLDPERGRTWLRIARGTYPDIGWAILLCAGIFLYLTIMPGKKKHDGRMDNNGKV